MWHAEGQMNNLNAYYDIDANSLIVSLIRKPDPHTPQRLVLSRV